MQKNKKKKTLIDWLELNPKPEIAFCKHCGDYLTIHDRETGIEGLCLWCEKREAEYDEKQWGLGYFLRHGRAV